MRTTITLPSLAASPGTSMISVIGDRSNTELTPTAATSQPQPDNEVVHSEWLTQANQILQTMLEEIKKAEADLVKAYASEEKAVYTNAILQQRIGSESAQKEELIRQLAQEKKSIEAKILNNNTLWKSEFENKCNAIQSLTTKRRNEFIADLVRWEEKLNRDFKRAKEQYDQSEIEYKQLEITNLSKQSRLETAREEFAKILLLDNDKQDQEFKNLNQKFEGVAQVEQKQVKSKSFKNSSKYTVPDLKNVIPSLPDRLPEPKGITFKVPDAKELAAKTLDDLDALAQTTESNNLKTSKNRILEELEQEKKKNAEELKKLFDEQQSNTKSDSSVRLLEQVKALTVKYATTAETIKNESAAAYAVVQKEHDAILEEIAEQQKLLQQDFDAYTASVSGKDENNMQCHDRINKYEKLKKQHVEAVKFPADWEKRIAVNREKYVAADNAFGLDHKKEISVNTALCTAKINEYRKLLASANQQVKSNSQQIDEDKYKLAQREILDLMTTAINKNIDFWHGQIDSFWGSRFDIDGTKVPAGIKQMHEFLKQSDTASTYEKLLGLIDIAKSRKHSGLGLFAKRTKNTTDVFYDLICSLIVPDQFQFVSGRKTTMMRVDVNVIKMSLQAIKDKKNSQLIMDEPQPLKSERTLKYDRRVQKKAN